MTIFRYILLGFSTLAAILLLIFWTVSGRSSDIVMFVLLAFFIANALYIFISRPTVKMSEILARASTGLALASLELMHQSQELEIKEVESENRRLEGEENNRFKLHVAKDMLEKLQSKIPEPLQGAIQLPKITSQGRQRTHALPLPPPISVAAEDVRFSNGHDAREKPTEPVIRASPASSLPPRSEAAAGTKHNIGTV